MPDDLVLNKKDVPEQEDNQIAAFGTSSFYVTGRRSRSGCSDVRSDVGCSGWMFIHEYIGNNYRSALNISICYLHKRLL